MPNRQREFLSQPVTLLAIGCFWLSGCERQSITSYRVPKEDYSKPAVMAEASGKPALPHLHWDLPAGWEEKTPDRMRVASFRIAGEEGRAAEVGIIPLPGAKSIEAETVNMWREELGLARLPADEVKGTPVEAGGLPAQLFEIAGTEPLLQGKFKGRTAAAIFNRAGTLWFVKMSGEESVVAAQKGPFQEFLKSLSFHDESHDAAPAAEEEPAAAKADWKFPAEWKQEAPGNMVLASYSVAAGGGRADITISSFPGDVGGLAANLNRWRGQIGLAPLAAGDVAAAVQTIDLPGGARASLVDFKGTNPRTGKEARLCGAVVPRGSQTWFYKMLGDDAVVGAEKGRFVEFIGAAF